MQSQSYRILLIGEDSSRTQTCLQMLHHAEDASFEVERKTNWQSALPWFASRAPDRPLPDAILWELPASGSAAVTFLKDTAFQQHGIPVVLLIAEDQKQLAEQMLEAGASERLVRSYGRSEVKATTSMSGSTEQRAPAIQNRLGMPGR